MVRIETRRIFACALSAALALAPTADVRAAGGKRIRPGSSSQAPGPLPPSVPSLTPGVPPQNLPALPQDASAVPLQAAAIPVPERATLAQLGDDVFIVIPFQAGGNGDPGSVIKHLNAAIRMLTNGIQSGNIGAAQGALGQVFGEGRRGASGAADAAVESEAAEIFQRNNPRSQAVEAIRGFGLEFDYAASELLVDNANIPPGYPRLTPVKAAMDAFWDTERELEAPFNDILAFAGRAETDPEARRFVALMGERYARKAYTKWIDSVRGGQLVARMPDNPLKEGGEMWDLASGLNGPKFFLGGIRPDTTYKLFDTSIFIEEYTQALLRRMRAEGMPGTERVQLVRQNIRTLSPPAKPLAVLRAKNVTTYVKGFQKDLESMVDWIAVGGQLVLDIEPHPSHQAVLAKDLGPLVKKLIQKGWTLKYLPVGSPQSHIPDWESFILTRPKPGARMDPASRDLWNSFLASQDL